MDTLESMRPILLLARLHRDLFAKNTDQTITSFGMEYTMER